MNETDGLTPAMTRQELKSFEQQLQTARRVLATAQLELKAQAVGHGVRQAHADLQALIERFDGFRRRLGVSGDRLADLDTALLERLGYRALEDALRLAALSVGPARQNERT